MGTVPIMLDTGICGLVGPVPEPGEDDTRKAFALDPGTVVELPEEVAQMYCTTPEENTRAHYLTDEEAAEFGKTPAKRRQRATVAPAEVR